MTTRHSRPEPRPARLLSSSGLAVALLCAACGGDDGPSDADPGTLDTLGGDTGEDSAVDVAPDIGADTAIEDIDEADVTPATPLPERTHLGPCRREVYIGPGDDPIFTLDYDYAEAPERVVVTRTSNGEADFLYVYEEVDFVETCRVPVEDPHGVYMTFVGCPRRVSADSENNGMISSLDYAVEYTYTGDGTLETADLFDIRGGFLGETWFFRYQPNGGLRQADRFDGDTIGATLSFDFDGEELTTQLDEALNGTTDYVITYAFDDDGQVIGAERSNADPSTGALRAFSRSVFDYSCWD